jgi:hypothetical protein
MVDSRERFLYRRRGRFVDWVVEVREDGEQRIGRHGANLPWERLHAVHVVWAFRAAAIMLIR